MGRRDQKKKKPLRRPVAEHGRLEVGEEELESILDRARSALSEEEFDKLKSAIATLTWLTGELEHKKVSLARLRKLLFGASTEKFDKVLKTKDDEAASSSDGQGDGAEESPGDEGEAEPTKRKGHGRNGADAYKSAERVEVGHPNLSAADACPDCKQGKVYKQPPHVLVRVRGKAPLSATVYELEALRCNLCGKVFVAPAPEGIGEKKYDASAASMIGLLKYGSGLPFNRLARLEGSLGVPLPASTQWDIVHEAARVIEPAYRAIIREAAQGEVLYNDDTTIKILELMGQPPDENGRTGMFTSGVVSTTEARKIALFFTGRKHAGENLEILMAKRAEELGPPIQMCDGLSRNLPGELETVVSNCLAHGRRRFVDVVENFPEACRHVLEELGVVYKNDAHTRKAGMTPEERLAFHKEHSGPVMEKLLRWFRAQIDDKKVEPNSPLGEAIAYMRKRWSNLTRFLQVAGAPLDNNICERALKKVILHRKNALFYKTENGAAVGDLFMSLIYSAELEGANPFDYLNALQQHAVDVRANPEQWMPWNYVEAVAALEQ